MFPIVINVDVSKGPAFALAFAAECRAVYLQHHNVLLEGPETAVEAVLPLLQPGLREPVIWKHARGALELPTSHAGALILQEVASLTIDEQARLLEWLEALTDRPQLVSTSSEPVFARVARGLFAESLYYRLNVVLMDLNSTHNPHAFATFLTPSHVSL